MKNILSQFADDTSAFLHYDQLSITGFSEVLQNVETRMGLKVSYDKTTLYRVGSIHKSDASLYTNKNFAWSSEPIDTLGVRILCDGTMDESNFNMVIDKLRKICSQWYNRQLTLSGRILVVNTLMGSLFVYKMLTLTSMSTEQLNTANGIINEFIWVGKRPKISVHTLRRRKDQGELRLVNLEAKQSALKIAQIVKFAEHPFV